MGDTVYKVMPFDEAEKLFDLATDRFFERYKDSLVSKIITDFKNGEKSSSLDMRGSGTRFCRRIGEKLSCVFRDIDIKWKEHLNFDYGDNELIVKFVD